VSHLNIDSFTLICSRLIHSVMQCHCCVWFGWTVDSALALFEFPVAEQKIHTLFVYKTKLNQTSYLWNCYIKSYHFHSRADGLISKAVIPLW